MSKENEKGKIYHLVLTEALTAAEAITPSTMQSALQATGSLSLYDQYYAEGSRTLEKASQAGSMSPHDISVVKESLDKMHAQSQEYYSIIVDLTKKDDSARLISIKQEIDQRVPASLQMIQDMHEKMLGTTTWNKLIGLFDLETSDKDKTALLKDTAHQILLDCLSKWIATRGKEKLFADLVHGPREAGIDIIVQVSTGSKPKFGIQVKNNQDVKAKDFAIKVKAQITESKKHKIQGLIIFLAADMTDPSVEEKIRSILSDISQVDDVFLRAISPEKAVTLISAVLS